MDFKPVRLGFIGCGSHAYRSHALIAARMPELFSIVALQDVNHEAMDRFAEIAPLARRAKHYEELLESADVEAVVIGTPDEFHLEQAQAAVEAHKHVLCEKPLWVGQGMSEVTGLVSLAKAGEKGLVFTSCHPRRFELPYCYYRKQLPLLVGGFGKVLEFNYRFFYEKPSTAWKHERSLLLDHLNHEIDLANFILGHSKTTLHKYFDSFDRYMVAGSREDGVAITFSGHRKLNQYVFWNELDIVLERRRFMTSSALTNDGMGHPSSLEWVFDPKLPRVHPLSLGPYPYSDCFVGIMKNFARSVRGLEANYLSFDDLRINTIAGNALVEYGKYAE